ncbi:tetratricopeptide repeat protein [Sphingomonas sp. ASV193]|uniref:SPOR domain-containing protein n=1 Tax=Sphingomonas sp. ASV193 TaxID=3144405 RepID=UPI0032E870A8
MRKVHGVGAALTAVGLIGSLSACSSMGSKQASTGAFGSKIDTSNIGLATRAQLALKSNDVPGAIALAERAVANSPRDAGFRALLGNCYLAAGRFTSADQAYSDSLALVGTQPQVVLKLALTRIATGRSADAVALLQDAQSFLDPSDVGLALALAGNSDAAVRLLEEAARAPGADGRIRQNLAFAEALGGHWDDARAIAAQDLPADQVEARVQQWLAYSKPSNAAAKVASFIGVTPAASDAGQPVRLALDPKAAGETRLAAATPVAPAPVAAPVVAAAPAPAPVEVATAAVVPPPPPPPALPAPVVAEAAAPIEAPAVVIPHAKPAPAPKPVRLAQARPGLTAGAARFNQSVPELHKAALRLNGKGGSVVQLGAYSSRERVAAAWSKASGRFSQLKAYQPVTASYASPVGMVYRLSVRGFASNGAASSLCGAIKRSGGTCFVRAAWNDAPVAVVSR